MLTKKCAKCKEQKPIDMFGRLSSSSDGLQYRCKPCIKVDKQEFRKRNPEKVKQSIANWRAKNQDKARAGNLRRWKRWYESNQGTHAKRVSDWFNKNPGKRGLYASIRRFRVIGQSINLSEEHKSEIEDIYAEAKRKTLETGIKYHVDHIFPLAGKECCGLHVPWNLQIIPANENSRKSNKMPEYEVNL